MSNKIASVVWPKIVLVFATMITATIVLVALMQVGLLFGVGFLGVAEGWLMRLGFGLWTILALWAWIRLFFTGGTFRASLSMLVLFSVLAMCSFLGNFVELFKNPALLVNMVGWVALATLAAVFFCEEYYLSVRLSRSSLDEPEAE